MKHTLNVWSVITRLSARQIWKPTFVWRVVLWLGGGWPVSCRATYFFGKVYYGQVVVQHVFQCEASKHTAKAPCCGWLTGSRERCGALWGQIQVIRCSILDHVLTATVIWGLLLFILIMLNIITKEISSNNEWRCRLADSSHSEFITCLFYYALLTKPPPRLEICQNIYTTKFSCVRILHIENA